MLQAVASLQLFKQRSLKSRATEPKSRFFQTQHILGSPYPRGSRDMEYSYFRNHYNSRLLLHIRTATATTTSTKSPPKKGAPGAGDLLSLAALDINYCSFPAIILLSCVENR